VSLGVGNHHRASVRIEKVPSYSSYQGATVGISSLVLQSRTSGALFLSTTTAMAISWLSEATSRPMISMLLLGFLATVAYGVFTVVSRLFLHPLAKFPGPRLAGATGLWKAYFQCTKSFTHELIKLHEVYGRCHAIQPEIFLAYRGNQVLLFAYSPTK
jgi:hypothetical protein